MDQHAFDAELVKRYDGPGPRYTSYPTAVQFHEGYGVEDYRRLAQASNDAPGRRPLSLYVHVPFCHSLCYYCGCHKIITRTPGVAQEYLDYLLREAGLHAELYDDSRPVVQLHFGGGTPTYLTAEEMEALVGGLGQRFRLATDEEHEFSIEIDPRSTDANMLAVLGRLGFNRLSMGIQDFDPRVQRAVNRVQPADETLALIHGARDAGFLAVSVDLIYGLPLQDMAGFRRTLETVVAARPDRFAVYNYAHLPRMFRAQRLIREEDLPSPAMKLDLLGMTIDFLTAEGYDYIGMDHFALPGDDLVKARTNGSLHRNFQGYSTYADHDLIGLGVSSIGSLETSYHQNLKLRKDYYACLERGEIPIFRGVELVPDDLLRRGIIQRIMCQDGLRFAEVDASYGIDFAKDFAGELAALGTMEEDGLVQVAEDRITVTPKGRFLLRPIAMAFDAYLPGQQRQGRFSKVI
jgi:oxygen-independent coproporphyrinogen-3 oxidase